LGLKGILSRMNVWLYHINPTSPAGWEYGWDVARPDSLMESGDRVWPTGNMLQKVEVNDLICVYTKNIEPSPMQSTSSDE